LGSIYATLLSGCPDHAGRDDTYEKDEPIVYTMNKSKRRSCMPPPCFTAPPGCPSNDFSPPSLLASSCPVFCLCLTTSFAMVVSFLCTAALAFAARSVDFRASTYPSSLGKTESARQGGAERWRWGQQITQGEGDRVVLFQILLSVSFGHLEERICLGCVRM
jgi:hypothetical protein